MIVRNLYNYSWFVTFGISFILYGLFMIGSPALKEISDPATELTPQMTPLTQ
jgi:cytosine/uracil/thiamine/allantoin permease